MRFEEYVRHGRWPLSPQGISVWGEFTGVADARGEVAQEEAVRRTFESLRTSFPSCVLVFDGGLPEQFRSIHAQTIRSRYALDQHNGRWVTGGPWELHLVEVAGLPAFDLFDLLEPDPSQASRGVAALLADGAATPAEYRAAFAEAKDDADLQTRLLRTARATIGFDHECWFSFETRDARLAEEVDRAGVAPPAIPETPPRPQPPAIPL